MDPELLTTCQQGNLEKLRNLVDTRSHEFFLAQENEGKRNILHFLFSSGCAEEALKALKPIQVVPNLVCQADIHGDNPLHVAASCGSLKVVRLVVDECKDLPHPPWTVKNNGPGGKLPVQVAVDRGYDDVAEFLLSVDQDFLRNVDNADSLLDYTITNQCQKTGKLWLKRHPEEVFKRRDPNYKMTILRLAIEKDFRDIIEAIVVIDTSIYDLQNERGENPLHIAVNLNRPEIVEILVNSGDAPPWRQPDKQPHGITPLHLALKERYSDSAKVMLSADFAFLSRLEAQAHSEQNSPNSLVKELEDDKGFKDVYLDTFLQFVSENGGEATKKLIKKHPEHVRFKDNSGRAILLHALNNNEIDTMILLLHAAENIPDYELESLLIEVDGAGKCITTALHKVRQQSSDKYRELLQIEAVARLKNMTDADGRTPLMKAILDNDSHLADALLEKKGVDVMSIKTKNGQTAAALLKDKCKESPKWEELYKKAAESRATKYIPVGTDLKEIRNTFSVVAALLITITFGAGFTVINHFDQNNGDVLGRRKPAFIIFVLSDTYAMCCSIIVLYSLIWAAVQEPDMALKLIDYSVDLLRQSFYGALLAFMTGAYTMLSSNSIWVAIIVLVMCSTIMISACIIFHLKCVHRFLVDRSIDEAESSA